MNNNNDRYDNYGPIGTHKGISPLKIIFIILLCLIALLAYKTYSKISGFLSFVSGEIDAVSSSIQHFGFSTSGPVSLDDENQNGMIIEDNSAESLDDENDGEEAVRVELPIPGEDKDKAKNAKGTSAAGTPETENTDFGETENIAQTAANPEEANATEDNANPPDPFPRKLNPFEDSLMGMDTSNGGNYKSEKIADGYFKGFTKLTLQNSLGTTQFIQKDGGIYQYAFFPPAGNFAETGTESQRGGIANETFRVLYDRVYGDGAYSKNKSQIYRKQLEFSSVCGIHKSQQWHFISVDGYSYGCNKYGFTVLPDQATDKQGIITVPDKSAAISKRRAKFMENLRKAQQAQQSGNAPQ